MPAPRLGRGVTPRLRALFDRESRTPADKIRISWRESIRADLRFALRYFAHHKGTTAILIAVIALGTGANTLIFSMFQAQFLRPAPAVRSTEGQVRVWSQERATRTGSWEPRGLSLPEFAALDDHRDVFSAVAAWTEDELILGGDSTAARSISAQFVTTNYFRVLGVGLAAGQGFVQSAIGSPTPDLAAVMSSAMAQQSYGSAAAAIGRQVLVNQIPVHIVGVAPPRFQGALRNMDEPALWIPMSARARLTHMSPRWLTEKSELSVFAHLAPHASDDRATALARQAVAHALPDSAARTGLARNAVVIGINSIPPGTENSDMMMGLVLILGVGVLILLVACTNVSSLMISAAVARRHEIAVRLSLGASRGRLLRQLITESTLLAFVGAGAGLALAWITMVYQMKTEIDGVDLTPDGGTLAFVLVMALATGVLFGLSPALHAIRGGLSGAMRDSSGGTSNRSRLQRGLVVTQIALSQPLLVLLGAMLAAVTANYKPLSPEMGRHVIAMNVHPLASAAPGQRPEIVDSLVSRIAVRPEVANAVPDATGFEIRGLYAADRLSASGHDTVPTIVHVQGTAPGWFSAVDVPIVMGRDVSLDDTTGAKTSEQVVIGSDLARALWGSANPIGRTIASPSLKDFGQDSIGMTVVGVYDASKRLPGMTWQGGSATTDSPTRVYTARGMHWRHDRVLVRTRGPAAPFLPSLQVFMREEAPLMPVTSMMTLAQADELQYQDTLRTAALAGACGFLALLLASLGLYGVVSLAVRQRTREIGIRIAVGAHPMGVARMFLRSGVRLGIIALALGLPLSIAALKIAMSQGIVIAPEINPYLIGIVIAPVLLAVAAAATWIPARRAAAVDPARTLRVE
jgi:predicted permease